jgi:hypothetical protein
VKLSGKNNPGEILLFEVGTKKIPTTVIETDHFTIENKLVKFFILDQNKCFITDDWEIVQGGNYFKIFSLKKGKNFWLKLDLVFFYSVK